mmetsp:Transcript_40603/g.88751  ORF Transcript_40603/g.88751 Transcript_40603/m.88751 type:complete len:368 (+) Transcript_40603:45-1148(+)
MWKWISLAAFCAQNSLSPIVFRLAGTEAIASEKPNTAVVLFCTEVVKLVISFLLFFAEVGFSSELVVDGIHDAVIVSFRSNLRLGVPSLVFAFQNALLQWSASDLSAAVWQLTYQGKALVTALFSVILLQKKFKRIQWLAILITALGIALVQLSGSSETAKKQMANAAEQSTARGFFLLLLAACCSGFASVYTEMVFKHVGSAKGRTKSSVWVQNMVMAVFSMVVIVCMPLAQRMSFDGSMLSLHSRPLFHGFTTKTGFLIVSNAVGGLLVAMVIKHADNILRAFASAVATINCMLMSVFLFGFELRPSFGLGSMMVILSTLLYGQIVKVPSEWWNSDFEICGRSAPKKAPGQKPRKQQQQQQAARK